MRIAYAIIAIALGAILIGSLWFAVSVFMTGDGDMPVVIWLAMGGGILFSLLIGCGLMALSYYSSRHGYDDGAGQK